MRHRGSALTDETRRVRQLYFLVGDCLVTIGTGAVAGLAVSSLVGPGWNMVAGMVAGMVLGTIVSIVILMLLTPFFGAFEVMLPGMAAGMTAGMIAGMWATGGATGRVDLVQFGAATGLAVLVAVKVLDRHVKRRKAAWTR
jgi:hypothetical protein